jgi:hypothetical protein
LRAEGRLLRKSQKEFRNDGTALGHRNRNPPGADSAYFASSPR